MHNHVIFAYPVSLGVRRRVYLTDVTEIHLGMLLHEFRHGLLLLQLVGRGFTHCLLSDYPFEIAIPFAGCQTAHQHTFYGGRGKETHHHLLNHGSCLAV